MAKLLFVRIAGGLGMALLALLIVGLIPFLSSDPTAGAGLVHKTPAFSVNREFKGDRLPVNTAAARDARRTEQHPREVPIGCDAAFSPISAPRLAYIYGRCMT
jgi:hypothetical protein